MLGFKLIINFISQNPDPDLVEELLRDQQERLRLQCIIINDADGTSDEINFFFGLD
jgi:hypothetical protein